MSHMGHPGHVEGSLGPVGRVGCMGKGIYVKLLLGLLDFPDGSQGLLAHQ